MTTQDPAFESAEPRFLGPRSWLTGVCLLTALVLWAHRASLGDGFVRDDFMWLVDARVQQESLWAFWTHRPSGYFRPLSNLWFMGFEGLFGLEPLAYRLGNAGLQVWNSIWLGLLAWTFCRSRAVAILAALGFVALAPPADSVDWISGVVSLLCAAFLLPAWTLYAELLDRREQGRASGALSFVVLLLCAGALGARESGILAVPGLAAVHLARRGPRALLAKRLYLDLLPGALLVAAYLALQWEFLQSAGQRGQHSPLDELRATVAHLPELCARLLDPTSRERGAVEPLSGWALLLGAPVLGAALLGRRGLALGALALMLAPIALIPYGPALASGRPLTDRYLYELALPALLLFGLGLGALLEPRGRLRSIGPVAAAILGVAFAAWHGEHNRTRYLTDFALHGKARASERFLEALPSLLDDVGFGQRVLIVAPPFVHRRHVECAVELFHGDRASVAGHPRLDLVGVSRTAEGLAELRASHGAERIWATTPDGSPQPVDNTQDWPRLNAAARINWRRLDRPPTHLDGLLLVVRR